MKPLTSDDMLRGEAKAEAGHDEAEIKAPKGE